jgi:molybdate transport system substrate-binding protein
MKVEIVRYLLSLCTITLICAIVIVSQSVIFSQTSPHLTIFAASSLTNVFDDLAGNFSEQYQIELTINYGGSSTLVAQLLQGAKADIFASANEIQIETLIKEDLVAPESVNIFAENELVIIVPQDNPADIQGVENLTQFGLLLVIAAPDVPIRIYTDILLDTLSLRFDDSYAETVIANVVSEERNVRQVVTRVALGEADAGIVYRTDVSPDIAELLQIIELPIGTSPRALYPIAPLLDSPQPNEAALFIDYVLSEAGQAILQKWGFCSPELLSDEARPEVTPDISTQIDTAIEVCED